MPGALVIARGLDTLEVWTDPAAEKRAVRVGAGMVLGVESEPRVFERGRPAEASPARQVDTPGAALDAAGTTWTTRQEDGLPEPGKEYAAEMKLVLFETDVLRAPAWDPRAGGHFHVLLERTLRQAEE